MRISQKVGVYLAKDSRGRAILFTAGAGILSKFVNFALLFAVVPLTLPYLGSERFGVLMTIMGYGALFGFLDFGIGSALIRSAAKSNAEGSELATANMLGSALVTLILFGIVFSALLYLVAHFINIGWLFHKLPLRYYNEVRDALLTFAAIFAIALPLQGLQKIYLGLQSGYITHLAGAFFSLTSLIILFFFRKDNLGLSTILIVSYGLPALAPVIYFPIFFYRRLSGFRLRWRSAFLQSKVLIRNGGVFFVLQLGYVLGWSVDSSLSSAVLGASAAGVLAMAQRLFQLVTVPLSLVNAPLWPAYADAAARNDTIFLRKTLFLSMTFTSSLALLSAVFVFYFQDNFVEIIFRTDFKIDSSLIILFGALSILEATGNCFAMYLNGLNIIRPQITIVFAFILVAVPSKFLMIKSFGLDGLVGATIFCYVLCVVVPYLTVYRRTVLSGISTKISGG